MNSSFNKYLKLSAIFAFFFLTSAALAWEVPTIIDFQGKLTDNNNNPQSGEFNMTFKILNQSSGGSLLWQENKLVNASSGLFSTLLGGNIAINLTFGEDYYVEVVVSGETFSPRYRVATSPYAFRANITTTAIAGTTTTPSFVINSISGQTGNLTEWKGSSGIIFAFVNASGTFNLLRNLTVGTSTLFADSDGNRVGIGTATPNQLLHVSGGNLNVSSGNVFITGALIVNGTTVTGGGGSDNTTLNDKITGNNNTLTAVLGQKLNLTGGILSGLFQVGNVSALNNISVNLTNALFVNSTLGWVGIGTANPTSRLDVSGTLTVEGINATGRQVADNTTTSNRITSENTTIAANLSSTGTRIGNLETKQSADNTTIAGNLSTTNTRIGNLETKQTGDNTTLTAILGQKLNLTGGTLSGLLTVLSVLTTNNLSVNFSAIFYVNNSVGRIGINTPNPSSVLDVSGTLTVEGVNVTGRQASDNTTQANAISGLQSDNTTQAALLGQKLNLTGGALSGLLSINNISATNNLSLNASGALYVNASQERVGIGTANPASRLDVSGTVTIDGVNITALVVGNNNTLFAILGQKLNLTGGTLSGLLSINNISTANNLSLNVSGALYVNGSQERVGIGTTNPSSRLDVSGTITSDGVNVTGRQVADNTTLGNKITTLQADNTTQGNLISGLQSDNTTQAALLGQKLNLTGGTLSSLLTISGASTANNLSLNVNNTLYVNASNDRVGIGTATPNQLVQVAGGNVNVSAGNIYVTGEVIVNGSALSLTTQTNVSLNYGYNSSGGNWVGLATTDTGILRLNVVQAISDNASNLVAGQANGSSLFLTANLTVLKNLTVGTTTLFVDQTLGFLGLGTTSQSRTLRLQVNGSGGVSIEANETAYLATVAGNIGLGTNAPSARVEVFGTNTLNNLSLNVNSTLYVNNSGGGNVGIGTTSPNYKLDVNGVINASGLLVNGTTASPVKSYITTIGNVTNTVTTTDAWNFTVPANDMVDGDLLNIWFSFSARNNKGGKGDVHINISWGSANYSLANSSFSSNSQEMNVSAFFRCQRTGPDLICNSDYGGTTQTTVGVGGFWVPDYPSFGGTPTSFGITLQGVPFSTTSLVSLKIGLNESSTSFYWNTRATRAIKFGV